MMQHILHKQILQKLPVGSKVKYIGDGLRIRSTNKVGVKVQSTKRYMKVLISGVEHRLRYYNLTCDAIEKAESVRRKLLGEPERNPNDDLPF